MKRTLGLILLSVVLFTLVGCSSTQKSGVVEANGQICNSCGSLLQGPSFSNNN